MAIPAFSVDFFDTGAASQLFTVGARVGVSTSNVSLNKNVFDVWNKNSWGTGFTAGAVADINFKNYLSIQPGVFFESRSGDYAYLCNFIPSGGGNAQNTFTQVGHLRSYNLTIPVLAAVHFNVSEKVRWNVELGPYFQIFLKHKNDNNCIFPRAFDASGSSLFEPMNQSKADFGFKMGTSLDIYTHYTIGVHYLAGCLNAWKPGQYLGGCNKEWTFTIGYNF